MYSTILQVQEPFLTELVENIDSRFLNTNSLALFSVFSPRHILMTDAADFGEAEMSRLAEQFPRLK